jgi:sugar phosphate isomerase/epimerase
MMKDIPFRIGTTSYIIPADILPNVRYLADKVDDIELVLFEVDDGPSNLLDEAQQAELIQLAEDHDLTYTVHLPLDLRLAGSDGEQHVSLVKAKKVIECTRCLHPHGYVLHLDGKEELETGDANVKAAWVDQALKALQITAAWAGDAALLCAENLDNYPPDFWDEVFERSEISRCIDIGHLWKDGHDAGAFLQEHLARARVLHIHGIAERDHKSLAHMPVVELERVMRILLEENFSGVMTVEIFSEEDFNGSMLSLKSVLKSLHVEWKWDKN